MNEIMMHPKAIIKTSHWLQYVHKYFICCEKLRFCSQNFIQIVDVLCEIYQNFALCAIILYGYFWNRNMESVFCVFGS